MFSKKLPQEGFESWIILKPRKFMIIKESER